jgi:hypothetical protein
MTTNAKRRVVNKENIDGICGKKPRRAYGRKVATITPNGTTLSLIQRRNKIINPLCQRTTPTSRLCKRICSKGRNENKKITLKPKNLKTKVII